MNSFSAVIESPRESPLSIRVLTLDGANCLSKYLFVLDKWEDISILIPYVIYTMFLTKIEFLFSEKVLLKYLTIKSDLKG